MYLGEETHGDNYSKECVCKLSWLLEFFSVSYNYVDEFKCFMGSLVNWSHLEMGLGLVGGELVLNHLWGLYIIKKIFSYFQRVQACRKSLRGIKTG